MLSLCVPRRRMEEWKHRLVHSYPETNGRRVVTFMQRPLYSRQNAPCTPSVGGTMVTITCVDVLVNGEVSNHDPSVVKLLTWLQHGIPERWRTHLSEMISFRFYTFHWSWIYLIFDWRNTFVFFLLFFYKNNFLHITFRCRSLRMYVMSKGFFFQIKIVYLVQIYPQILWTVLQRSKVWFGICVK
jgi:hypothetical protein